MHRKVGLIFLFVFLSLKGFTAQTHLMPIPFTESSRWKNKDSKKVLIYNPVYRKLLYVSDETKGQDNLVRTHRYTTEPRNFFQLKLFNTKDRLYKIYNPSYKKYLFVSDDKKGSDHLVEAHNNANEERNRFQLTFLENEKLYLLANPKYGRYTFVSNDQHGDDNYVEAHTSKGETRNHFAILHIPELSKKYKANWIRNNFDKIKDKRLLDLVLPGTHDSATYNLTTKEADLDTVKKVIRKFSVEHVRKWSKAQDESIYNQLIGGVRYFDLRPHASGGKAYIHHGLRGDDFNVVLDDVKKFVNKKKRAELIILSISHFHNFKETDYLKLRKNINSRLSSYLYRPDTPKVGEKLPLVTYHTVEKIMGPKPKKSKIIILTSSDLLNNETPSLKPKYYPVAWDIERNVFDEWSDSDSFEQMKKDQKEKSRKRFRRGGKLFVFSWTLSPQIPKSPGAIKDLKERDLHWLSRQANVSLPYFASKELYKLAPCEFGANILYVDFYKDAFVVETALMLNGLI